MRNRYFVVFSGLLSSKGCNHHSIAEPLLKERNKSSLWRAPILGTGYDLTGASPEADDTLKHPLPDIIVYKVGMSAEKSSRRPRGFKWLTKVIEGVKF